MPDNAYQSVAFSDPNGGNISARNQDSVIMDSAPMTNRKRINENVS